MILVTCFANREHRDSEIRSFTQSEGSFIVVLQVFVLVLVLIFSSPAAYENMAFCCWQRFQLKLNALMSAEALSKFFRVCQYTVRAESAVVKTVPLKIISFDPFP